MKDQKEGTTTISFAKFQYGAIVSGLRNANLNWTQSLKDGSILVESDKSTVQAALRDWVPYEGYILE